MFNSEDRNVVNKILENQKEILKTLKSINDNIIKYCGGEHEFKTEELKQKMLNANFNKNQLGIVQEFVDYKLEEYLEKENICKITNIPCCYCQQVCNSRANK